MIVVNIDMISISIIIYPKNVLHPPLVDAMQWSCRTSCNTTRNFFCHLEDTATILPACFHILHAVPDLLFDGVITTAEAQGADEFTDAAVEGHPLIHCSEAFGGDVLVGHGGAPLCLLERVHQPVRNRKGNAKWYLEFGDGTVLVEFNIEVLVIKNFPVDMDV